MNQRRALGIDAPWKSALEATAIGEMAFTECVDRERSSARDNCSPDDLEGFSVQILPMERLWRRGLWQRVASGFLRAMAGQIRYRK